MKIVMIRATASSILGFRKSLIEEFFKIINQDKRGFIFEYELLNIRDLFTLFGVTIIILMTSHYFIFSPRSINCRIFICT